MRARITIEYEPEWPPGLDQAAVQEREAERWMTSETVLGLRGTTTVRVELLDEPGWWQERQ